MKNKPSREDFLRGLTLVYVVLIVSSNVMASKVVNFFGLLIDAGTLTYPLTFMIGDLLAELYGYRAAKHVILWGFAANLMFSLFALAGTLVPAHDPADILAASYDTLFAYNIRILGASFAAYAAGSLTNAGSLVLIRRLTGEKWLAFRTIGSTVVGALIDTALFTVLAWAFTLSAREMLVMGVESYAVKLLYESVIATPAAYGLRRMIRKHVSGF
ncbi:MAG: queuosine precursor transporter [Oscillospiraceae bacterium]|jgi:uncharacterized integral membrane protein (TIGR00697 family)|nr:queuosine precursor transporter [Oscillospiraceae bacterium]